LERRNGALGHRSTPCLWGEYAVKNRGSQVYNSLIYGDGKLLLSLEPKRGITIRIVKQVRKIDIITWGAFALAVGIVVGVLIFTASQWR
jgi:hypothetical protein